MDDQTLISNSKALMHIVRANIGVGLLNFPWAVEHAGIIIGPIALIFIAIAAVSCIHALAKCSRYFSKNLGLPFVNYGDVAYFSVLYGPFEKMRQHANKAKIFANFLLCVTQISISCIFIIFVGQNTRQIVGLVWQEAPSDRAFMSMCIPFIILMTFITELSLLVWLSCIANIAFILAFGITISHILLDLPPLTSNLFTVNLINLPIFFGSSLYVVEGISVILPIENVMKTPESFPLVLNIGMGFVISMYLIFGMIGFIKYGIEICGSITLNLPIHDTIYVLAKCLFVIEILLSYPIQFYVPLDIIWKSVGDKIHVYKKFFYFVIRGFAALLTCLMAIAFPTLGSYISLVGASTSSLLAFFLPCTIEILTFHSKAIVPVTETENGSPENEEKPLLPASKYGEGDSSTSSEQRRIELRKWIVVKNIILIIFGFIGGICGTIAAAIDIVQSLKSYDEFDKCNGAVTLSDFTKINKTTQLG